MYPYDKYQKKNQRTYRMIRIDPVAWDWLQKHPYASADIRLCHLCGSYYMPSLGHECKGV